MTENKAKILGAAIKGASRGGPAGAILSIVSGAAVIVTIPAWIPFVATGVAISTAAVATGAAIGAVTGAAIGAEKERRSIRKRDDRTKKEFGI